MGTASERKQPVRSFADVRLLTGVPPSDVQEYDQLSFDGLERAEEKEVEIDNCKVTKSPVYKKVGDGATWNCTVEYQMDLWHQEDFGGFMLHASQNAETASALKLKLGDMVLVRGVPWIQHITLRGGKVQTVHHLNVTDIQIISRAPRQKSERRQQVSLL
jgi:hypothetical protein